MPFKFPTVCSVGCLPREACRTSGLTRLTVADRAPVCLTRQAESSVAATFATVLALAVAIESIAVLPTAVAAVLPVANESIAVLPVESIFQEALDVWSPRLPRGRPVLPDRRRARAAPATPHQRQTDGAGRGRIRASAGRGAGLRIARESAAASRTPPHGPRSARAGLSLGWGAWTQRASGRRG